MEKFLNFSFKFGKLFTVIFLVILFFSMLCSGIKIATTFKNIKLETPSFTEIHANLQAEKTKQVSMGSTKAEPYIVLLNEVAKKHLSDFGRNMLLASVKQVDDKYRVDYIEGFDKTLDETKGYINFAKLGDKQARELLEGVIANYNGYFQRNLNRMEYAKMEQKTDRIAAFTVFVSSILLFVLCLIVPLLIKIEENTRK